MKILLIILTTAPPLLLAVILHEIAHGYIAGKLGDPTARRMKRITLNPLAHIDPFMTLALPALLIFVGSPIIFGGAKPVPVNPNNFKNPRRDMAWVAIAGPITNFILAFLSYIAFELIRVLQLNNFVSDLFLIWSLQSILINLVLGLFNLCPIPPLDGGRIAVGILPLRFATLIAKLESYGILIVFALLYTGLLDTLFAPLVGVREHLLGRLQ